MRKKSMTGIRQQAAGILETGKGPIMKTMRMAEQAAEKVPAEHRERFMRELGEHLIHTFLHANVLMGGGLALAGGVVIEKAVDAAASASPGFWGFGWLRQGLTNLSESTFVENLPEGLCFLAVFFAAAGNYLEYRRFLREARRETKQFSIGFLADIRNGEPPAAGTGPTA